MRIHKPCNLLRPGSACFFLDVDGTLLEFGPTPDAVGVHAELLQLLVDVAAACEGALALISGRSLPQLDALFGPRQWPAAGLHGAQRRDARGRLHVHPGDPIPDQIRDALTQLAASQPGVLLEDKGPAIAVHYRLAPVNIETELRQRIDRLVATYAHGALQVQPGAYVLELKPAGATKARAIEQFLLEAPFADRRPIFAGDDLTDLDGFATVERHAGLSIAVGPRVRAMLNLPSPDDLHALLREFLEAGIAA